MLTVLAVVGIIIFAGSGVSTLMLLRKARWRGNGQPSHALSYVGICAVLALLTSCGGGQNSAAAPTTPVVPTPTVTLSTGSTTRPIALGNADWPTYHHDGTRTGYVLNEPDPKQLTAAWNTKLDGAVYAEPLVVGGHVIVATENDTLYSLDAATGDVQWHTHVGTPVAQSTLPCGDIDPLGMTGTPVYDPATGLVFAVAEISGPQHILVGIDANNGDLHVRVPVDIPAMEPDVHQQRAALLLSNNMIYVAYGGLAGDCGNYHGTVVAVHTNGQGPLLSYQVPTPREGGIWAPSGPAVDANGRIYVSVGNGETTSGAWDHSDSVLRLSPMLQMEDAFAPTDWQDENNHDTDLGSVGPTLLPNGLVFIAGKSGTGYILHANALGGVGGQVAEAHICNGLAMGGTAVVGSQILVPCTDGIRSVTLGSGGQLTVGWHVAAPLPPIVGGHTVYALDANGTLYAYALDTGALRSKLSLVTTSIPNFATPTVSAGRVFVPTRTGVTGVTIS